MFEEFDTLTWVISAVIVLVIVLAIWHEIIRSASRSTLIAQLLIKQNTLLAELKEELAPQKATIQPKTSGEITDLNEPGNMENLLDALKKDK